MNAECFKIESLSSSQRVNIYAGIHKAVRAILCDTLSRVAKLDIDDPEQVASAMAGLREMLAFCTDHIAHEEHLVHPAMEERSPGSSGNAAEDHEQHAAAVASLHAASQALEHGAADTRDAAWHRLQRELAVFVGENLLHMDLEENANSAVLQACYTDQELIALHERILASLTPQEMAASIRWMLIGSSPAERAQLMTDIRADAPPPAFEAMLDIARHSLSAEDWDRLTAALTPRPVSMAA